MEALQHILTLANSQQDIAALWLYGSRARGDHHPESDYDLAVGFRNWEEDPLERRLRPELLAEEWREACGLPENRLSIVDIAIAPIPLGIAILSEGKLLLDRYPDIRLRLESRILSRWELDYLHHQKQFGGL